MINSPPEIVRLAVDLHEDLIQVPLPIRIYTHPACPLSADLGCEHRAEPIPPKPDCLMADFDAKLVQKILHVPKRKWKPDIHHHRQTDDIGAGLEVTKWGTFCHP